LHACSQTAQAAGCARIDWIVATSNADGRAFYSKLGAEVFEQVRHARLSTDAIRKMAIASA
jgi:hypothetical protein